MNRNRRYMGANGGRDNIQHRGTAPSNYPVPANSHPYNSHLQNNRVVNTNVNARRYPPNNNFQVVTHRMEQQYTTVEIINPAEQSQQYRQHGSNVVSVAPIPKISQPPPRMSCMEPQPPPPAESMAVAPFTGGVNSHTLPISPSPPLPEYDDDEDDISIPELDDGGFHYKKLGELMGAIYMKSKQRLERLYRVRKLNQKLQAQKEALESQLSSIQTEKEEQIKLFDDAVAIHQAQESRAAQECASWRSNAMRSNQQLESVNADLAQKELLLKSLQNDLTKSKAEQDRNIQRIRNLEESEKQLRSEIDISNQSVEKHKQDINKKSEALETAEEKYREKVKDFTKLESEHTSMKKALNEKILVEQKTAQELESSKKDCELKINKLKETVEKYRAEKRSLELSQEQSALKMKELEESLRRKEDEIISISEARDSCQLEREAQRSMLKEQNDKILQLQSEVESLERKNHELSSELRKETEVKTRILNEHMEMFTKPTLLNELMKERFRSPSSQLLQTQPQLALPQPPLCTSPVASEEVPEPSSIPQMSENDCSSGSNTPTSKTSKCTKDNGEISDPTRKRKHPSSSTSDEKCKDVRRRKDSNDETISNGNASRRRGLQQGTTPIQQGSHGRKINTSSPISSISSSGGSDDQSPRGGDQNKAIATQDNSIRINLPNFKIQ